MYAGVLGVWNVWSIWGCMGVYGVYGVVIGVSVCIVNVTIQNTKIIFTASFNCVGRLKLVAS